MDLSSLLSSANPLIGGIVGVLGSAYTGWMNFKSQKLKYENDALIRNHDLDMIKAETDANVKIVETQTKGTIDLKDAEAYAESQKYGNINYSSSGMIEKLSQMENSKGNTPWYVQFILVFTVFSLSMVDVFKGIMRPGLTAFHVALTSYITVIAWEVAKAQEGFLNASDAVSLITMIINTVLFLTVTCVTWWFGDRRMAKFLMRLNDGNHKK